MAKQENAKPQNPGQPAASGSGNPKTIGTKPIRKFDGPSLNTKPVGNKDAPYYDK